MSSYAIPPEVSDNFTQDEIQEYVSQFKEIDEDGNGTLDKNEMTELMKSLGMEEAATPDKVQALIEEVDQDVKKKNTKRIVLQNKSLRIRLKKYHGGRSE